MKAFLVAVAFAAASVAPVAAPDYPGDEEVIGSIGSEQVKKGDSLVELARRYDVGFNAIATVNPSLDPIVPEVGATAVLPTSWIVPAATEPGTIVVNLSEMRLYFLYYRDDISFMATFPIGIGSEGTTTPPGQYRIVEKRRDPEWLVPASVRREKPWLPGRVPPGPDNPLGSHALRLSRGGILIHGTNKPWGVGRRVSHGCIRLYPEDIPRLYRLVSVGTPVIVVREPVKVGLKRERVYVEVHRDATLPDDLLKRAERLLTDKWLMGRADRGKLRVAVREKRGIPVDISAGSAASRK